MPHSSAEAAERWLSTWALNEIETTGSAQIDIDEVFAEPPTTPIQVGIEVLEHALASVRRMHPDVVGLLVAPLSASAELDQTCPPLRELAKAPWQYGPGQEVVGRWSLTASFRTATRPTTGLADRR